VIIVSDKVQLSRVDLPRLGIGSAVAAALALGLAVAFFQRARSTPDVSSTAALNTGFSAALGAGLGLAVGSALAAAIVRRGSRWVAGVVAGVVAYGVVSTPLLVFTRPSDSGLAEMASIALFVLLLLAPFVVAGATLGSLIARGFERWRSRPAR
jgi:hypothetical protein